MESANPKVSIIVPMYKVEQYIGRCLDSLLAQTLREIEIIAVDDGTPDSSGEIAEGYARHDHRIKVLHQANGGLGPARNAGVDHACGDFIGFVDSDDWVHPDMFENLYTAAVSSDSDIAVGGFETWTNGVLVRSEPHPLAGKILLGDTEIEPYRKLLYGRLPDDSETTPYPVAVWLAIYRKELLDRVDAGFSDVLSEDLFFNLKAYRAAGRIVHIPDRGYCYRKDCQDSITRSFSPEKAKRYVDFFETLAACVDEESDAEECLLRARRKMIDYSRSYVFMVEKSGLDTGKKVEGVSALLNSDAFARYCATYPSAALPGFHSLFHKLLLGNRIRTALALTRTRMIARGER